MKSFQECKPAQDEGELDEFFRIVAPMAPKVVVEIGVYEGGMLCMFERMLAPDLLVGIDDTERPLGREYGKNTVIFAPRRSEDAGTIQELRDILGGKGIDLLFIDGGHRFEQVKRDFENYSPLVVEGGVVALHDINVTDYDFCQVKSYWNSIKGSCRHAEIVHSVGIGILWPQASTS